MPIGSAEPRRVVVLTEEVFHRLRDKASLTVGQEDQHSLPPPSEEDPNNTSEPFDEESVAQLIQYPSVTSAVQHAEQPVAQDSEQQSDQILKEQQSDAVVVKEEGIGESSTSLIDSIPNRFRKPASSLLDQLGSLDGIGWSKSHPETESEISIDGVAQGVSILQFLKATCVPFTTIRLPPTCRQFLERHSIKTRNHLTKTSDPPQWHPYFRL